MDTLIKFLKNIHALLVFIVLEVISIVSLVSGDVRRNSVFNTSANTIIGNIYDFTWRYVGYFNLKEENAALMQQLSNIRSSSKESFVVDTAQFRSKNDSLGVLKYKYITASVVKNSVSRQNNFMTIDVGSDHGVAPDMAVVSPSGVIGIVVAVSSHYALAISVLNSKIGVSAKLKSQSFYGSVVWPGEDYRYVILHEIPNHVDLSKGDTIVTSGYSAIFPPGLPVGTIDDFEKNSDDNFYTIKVKLLTDLKRISDVMIIENVMQKEQLQLEEQESKFVQ
ncbi:MAG: rod shape-determining protein MreC [Bacteroidales bacterium]|nr:rod shape-determining protein MreC [Bacteroidales bacterium]